MKFVYLHIYSIKVSVRLQSWRNLDILKDMKTLRGKKKKNQKT